MIGHSQSFLAASLTAIALITAADVQAHTGNQMYDTLETITGVSPERSEPRSSFVELADDNPPQVLANFLVEPTLIQAVYAHVQ